MTASGLADLAPVRRKGGHSQPALPGKGINQALWKTSSCGSNTMLLVALRILCLVFCSALPDPPSRRPSLASLFGLHCVFFEIRLTEVIFQAIASLITQVSPTGQPARAPVRSSRPRQGTKRTPSAKSAPATAPTASGSAGSTVQNIKGTTFNLPATTSTSDPQNIAQAPVQTSLQQPESSEISLREPASSEPNETEYSLPSTSESATKAPLHTSSTRPPSIAPSTASVANRQSTTNNAAAPSTSLNRAVPPTSQPRANGIRSVVPSDSTKPKKKRKSFLASLFSCFGSFHEGEVSNVNMTERKPGQANATRPMQQPNRPKKDVQVVNLQQSNDKAATGTTSTTSTGIQLAAAAAAEQNALLREQAGSEAGAGAGGTEANRNASLGTPAIQESSSAPPSPKAEISPEVIAATSKTGATLPLDETEGILSGAVQAPGSEGLTPSKKSSRRKSTGEVSTMAMGASEGGDESRVSSAAGGNADDALEDSEEEYMDEDERIIAQGGAGIPIGENGLPRPLLVELSPSDGGRKCLVLDLDETLVHSSFKVSLPKSGTQTLLN